MVGDVLSSKNLRVTLSTFDQEGFVQDEGAVIHQFEVFVNVRSSSDR